MLKLNHMPEEILEAYVLGKLQGEQLDAVEDHLLVCDLCRQSLEETESYVQTMRSAAARLRKDGFTFPRPAQVLVRAPDASSGECPELR